MENTTVSGFERLFLQCDLCRVQGILDRNIFAREGFHYCRPCLFLTEGRRQSTDLLSAASSARADDRR